MVSSWGVKWIIAANLVAVVGVWIGKDANKMKERPKNGIKVKESMQTKDKNKKK